MNPDIPDLIAGALGVSRGTAYDLMRDALASEANHAPTVREQPAPVATPHEQQEPVAFEIRAFNTTQALIKRADVAQEKADVLERGFGGEADVTIVPLYTTPPAIKPWVGLTPAEVHDIWCYNHTPQEVCDAIEAKLREKNA